MHLLNRIRSELKQLGLRPRKSLGQNFLINEGVYRKIITALEIKPDDTVIEIGPGLGTLTEYLATSGACVVAVEKDHKLAEYLKAKFFGNNRVIIVEEDILKFLPSDYKLQTINYKLVGNIPYYLTSHLLRTVFEEWPRPRIVVLTIQKEVAQRITARPPDMSLLAISVRYYADANIIGYVSRKSFWPEPSVDSALLRLNPKSEIRNPKKDEQFFKIVKIGFAGKRKQLVNNLARGLGLSKSVVEEKLNVAGIEPTRRAETLTVSEWESLSRMF